MPLFTRWPRRRIVVLLAFLAVVVCYLDRVNLSVAIIPMATQLGWSLETQGRVLSSFFVGYLLLQIVGGRLADRFGGKVVLGTGVLLWSLFTILTPPAAYLGLGALILTRVGCVPSGDTPTGRKCPLGRTFRLSARHARVRTVGPRRTGMSAGV